MEKSRDINLTPDEEAKLLLIAEDMTIEYNGEYPNLCSGELIVKIGLKTWNMGSILSSGGSVSFSDDWDECVTSGPWEIEMNSLPSDFPKDLYDKLKELVNEEIRWGCCGGCV